MCVCMYIGDLGVGSCLCQPCSNVDAGGEDNVMSNNAASSTPIRSLLFWTTCKLLLVLLLLLLLLLSFTSVVVASSLLCRSCCCCGDSFGSRPRSCLLFFRYRMPQALHRDLRPVGPPRHMGVEMVRHSTQLLLPSSTTPIPSTFRSEEPMEAAPDYGVRRSVAGLVGGNILVFSPCSVSS